MSLHVINGVDFSRAGDFKLHVVEATGSLATTVLIDSSGLQHADGSYASPTVVDASPRWCHEDLSSVLADYDDLAAGIKAALDAGSAARGNTWTYTVTWSRAAQTYTISASGGNTALTFTNTLTQNVLGFAASTSASAASHTGTIRPKFSIISAATALSNVTRPHAVRGTIHGMVTANGFHYAVQPATQAKWCRAKVVYESAAASTIAGAGTAVYATDATSACPWTWEDFFDYVGAVEPVRVDDGTHDWLIYLDPDEAHFDPERAQTDWDMWHIWLAGAYQGAL